MPLLKFPNELLYLVVEGFCSADLNSLCKTNRRLNTILRPLLNKSMLQKKDRLLLWAARKGREPLARLLLENGADVNFSDDISALCYAVSSGHEGVVKLLLEHGADIENKRGNFQRSALHDAAWELGRESIARLLIEKGADLNSLTSNGIAPLHYAVLHQNIEMIKLLLEKGCDVNIHRRIKEQMTALHYAARNGNEEIIKILLEAGACVDPPNIRQRTPFHEVMRGGAEAGPAAKLLLERGSDINATDWQGMTPLLVAAKNGCGPMVKWLLDEGAFFAAVDEQRRTVLHIVAESPFWDGDVSTIGLLLEKGIGLDVQDRHGHTPLHSAAGGGVYEMVSELLKHGADIRARDKNGATALHSAAKGLRRYRRSFPAVQVLLDNGAEINALDDEGRTALHWAVIQGQSRDVDLNHDPVIKLLLENGADPNIRDKSGGGTALHWATYCGGNWGLLRNLLVDFGADPSIRDNKGRTADDLVEATDSNS